MSMDEYAKARAAFVASEAEIKKIGEFLVHAGTQLRDYYNQAFFSNVPGVGYPAEVVATGRQGINASNWPTAEALAKQLADHHQTRQSMMDAWGRLSTEQKQSMQRPPIPDSRLGRR